MRKWPLLASIVLNVFLVAAWIVHFAIESRPPRGPMAAMERLGDKLPSSDRAMLRAAFEADFEHFSQSRHAMDEMEPRLRAVLSHEPFDKAAFRALLVESDQIRANFGHSLTDTLPDVVEKMSVEGRHELAEAHFFGPPPPPPPRP